MEPDETRSIRSNARSLSINVNKISKVQRVDDDARSNAISKIKDKRQHQSVERAVSRGKMSQRSSTIDLYSQRFRTLQKS